MRVEIRPLRSPRREYSSKLFAIAVAVVLSWTSPDLVSRAAAVPTDAAPDLGPERSGSQNRTARRAKAPKIEMVLIPAGTFTMGSNDAPDEQPTREVKISRPFYLGKFEVTQAQWKAVMGSNPSRFTGENLPVERVTWDEAHEFARRLSAMTGEPYRLPTEAEWEYACRAGTTAAWSFGTNPRILQMYGWFAENSNERTHPVGSRRPNAWGLHDMHGNVWEWCSDWYAEDYYANAPALDPKGPDSGKDRVIRSGSYGSDAVGCRSANRYFYSVDDRFLTSGLRVAKDS